MKNDLGRAIRETIEKEKVKQYNNSTNVSVVFDPEYIEEEKPDISIVDEINSIYSTKDFSKLKFNIHESVLD